MIYGENRFTARRKSFAYAMRAARRARAHGRATFDNCAPLRRLFFLLTLPGRLSGIRLNADSSGAALEDAGGISAHRQGRGMKRTRRRPSHRFRDALARRRCNLTFLSEEGRGKEGIFALTRPGCRRCASALLPGVWPMRARRYWQEVAGALMCALREN